jgi:hypothetical protein
LCSYLFLLGAEQLLRVSGRCWSGYLLIGIQRCMWCCSYGYGVTAGEAEIDANV